LIPQDGRRRVNRESSWEFGKVLGAVESDVWVDGCDCVGETGSINSVRLDQSRTCKVEGVSEQSEAEDELEMGDDRQLSSPNKGEFPNEEEEFEPAVK